MVPPANVLILPGLGGSGPDHWQTRWEQAHGYVRVEQANWDAPSRDAWMSSLTQALASRTGPCVLVAHSLACALVAHHARERHPTLSRVAAALLVAPADVDDPAHTPECTRVFAPMPLERLPYPCTVAASTTDPFIGLARAAEFAEHWGATFENIGDAGHINADSNLGAWPAGHRLLHDLLARV